MIQEIDLVNGFKKYFGNSPKYYIDTGGRFEIIGNHTDHNHGLCLVANCSLRIRGVVTKNSEKVNIQSKGFPFITFNVNDLEKKESEYSTTLALCKGVLFKMKEEGFKIGGFDIYMDSELPDGSGVSSSAAVESLFGYIISYLYNDGKVSPLLIAQNGQFSENNYFHKPCGLLDQIGTSFGNCSFIDFKDIKNPTLKALDFKFPVTLYLIKSIGNHSSLTHLYAAIPAAMHEVAEKLEGKEFLRDVNVLNVYDRIDKLDCTDEVKRKAKHFFIENNNVRYACKAIEDNNLEDFLGCIRNSQYSSKVNLENTYVKGEYKGSMQNIVDDVSKFIGKDGAIRIHGGGFKGTCLCFIKNDFVPKFDEYLAKNYPENRYFKVHISDKAVNFKEI
ncbi:MAG: galactokinase family protein [Bacilli bacterium]|jgi:galactokinase